MFQPWHDLHLYALFLWCLPCNVGVNPDVDLTGSMMHLSLIISIIDEARQVAMLRARN
jgi:hypothetical protein